MSVTDELRAKRRRRQRRFERPLRDLAGYLAYAVAPLIQRLTGGRGWRDPRDPELVERREHARRRPFSGADAMAAYAERMLLWAYLSFALLVLWIPSNFVLQPDGSRPVMLQLVLDYLPLFGMWTSLAMLLISSAKGTVAWIFGTQSFGRDTEEPFEDHSWIFDAISADPGLRASLDPPAPILGRLLRPFLTPSNTETLVGVLVGLFMTYGGMLDDPALQLAGAAAG